MTTHNVRGNWLVLAGIVLYLCEFVGIGLAGDIYNEPGTPADEVLASYEGAAGGAGFLVGWMALVLTGRVLIVIGLRAALTPANERSPLLDWAVAAMALTVAFEVGAVAMRAGAAALADGEGGADAVLALDQASSSLGAAIYAPYGVAAVLCAVAMWQSGAFGWVLPALGGISGLSIVAAGLFTAPSQYEVVAALSSGVILWWVWALWTGVLLVRRRPSQADAAGG